VPFAVLLAALAEVPDPRRAQGQRYSMSHLLLFSVLAVLTGATSYKKIIAFIALQRERLNAVFGACFRRAPAVNTLRHLFLALGRDDLEAAFRRHARDLSAGDTASMPRTVALDGKTLRGSFDHLTDRKAVHVLSAFASDAALVLAHQELAGAPDEVAAVPRLMSELGLTGVLFTADALHCQKDGFAQAAATGNALLVRVKDNQPTLGVSAQRKSPCMRPWPGFAPPGAPSTATRPSRSDPPEGAPAERVQGTAAAADAKSIAASRCSTPPASWMRPGSHWSAVSHGCRA
jgi:hypothetical protein